LRRAEAKREDMHSSNAQAWSVQQYKDAQSIFRAAQSVDREHSDIWQNEIRTAKKRIDEAQQAERAKQKQSTKPEDLDPRLVQWVNRNPWFGNDKRMTDFAVQKGHELTGAGYEPGSDAFFAEIDRSVRNAFPDHFQRNNQNDASTNRKVDPKAERWASRNPWFGHDKEMSDYAMSVHKNLINRGFDPESDAYYRSIDAAMRKKFPGYFNR